MLDVYELNVFLIAAETENFSEAARHLNLTQPAVSMQIHALEKKLDVALFRRVGRNLVLTEQGRALMPLAREMVNRVIQIEEEVEALKGHVVGHLKIGCSTTTGKYILPPLVARFRQLHPKVQVSISHQSRDQVLSELCEGLTQLAVISGQPVFGNLEYYHFYSDYIGLMVPAEHAWAQRERIVPEELRQADFIIPAPELDSRQEVEAALPAVGLNLSELNMVMEIGNAEAISVAVEAGIGAAFVSRSVSRRGLELGRVKEIEVTGLSVEREIFIAYSRRRPATLAQAEFWSLVVPNGVESRPILADALPESVAVG
jgi:DNA-binding transcriptional LysR family regulator